MVKNLFSLAQHCLFLNALNSLFFRPYILILRVLFAGVAVIVMTINSIDILLPTYYLLLLLLLPAQKQQTSKIE